VKYVITWEARPNVTEEAVARSLQVFSKWAPSEGVTYREFLGRLDGGGGYAVVETDDPALVAKDTNPFGVWFDFRIVPVIEIADSAAIAAEGVAWVASIT